MGRPAAAMAFWYQAQLTACSGKTPVCLKPVGLTISVRPFQPIFHLAGRGRRFSQLPPPLLERW